MNGTELGNLLKKFTTGDTLTTPELKKLRNGLIVIRDFMLHDAAGLRLIGRIYTNDIMQIETYLNNRKGQS